MQNFISLQDLVDNFSSGAGVLDYNGNIVVSNEGFKNNISDRKEFVDKLINFFKNNKNVPNISLPYVNEDAIMQLKLSRINNTEQKNYIFLTYDDISEKLAYFKLNEDKKMLMNMFRDLAGHDILNYSQIILTSLEYMSAISDINNQIYKPLKGAVNNICETVEAICGRGKNKTYTINSLIDYILGNANYRKDIKIEKSGVEYIKFGCTPISRYAILALMNSILGKSIGNYIQFLSYKDANNIHFDIKIDGIYLPEYLVDFISTEYNESLEDINKIYTYLYHDSFITEILKNDNIFMDIKVKYDENETFTTVLFNFPNLLDDF